MDIPAFERYVAQVKVYYTDCATQLPESERQFPIMGLNLLRLLAQSLAEMEACAGLKDTLQRRGALQIELEMVVDDLARARMTHASSGLNS